MLGGACPRCRSQQRPLGGEIVYSAAEPLGGSGGGGFPISYVALGVFQAQSNTVTTPAITVSGSVLLCPYTISVNDGSAGSPPIVKWGSQTITRRQGGGTATGFTNLYSDMVTSGTQAITIDHSAEPAVRSLGIIVFALAGATSYLSSTETNSGGTPVTSFSYNGGSQLAGRVTVMNVGIENQTGDVASITTGATMEQKLQVTDATDPFFLYQIFDQHVRDSSSTLSTTLPIAKDWFVDGNHFQ